MAFQDKNKEYEHRLLEVRRTARVVRGGRRFSFRAAVVAGNRRNRVGVGVGKGQDVQTAVARALERAIHSAIPVALTPYKSPRDSTGLAKQTLPHATDAKFASAKVLLRPARHGRGIIAGGAVRTVCELAGIGHVTGKILSRSGNKINVARATIRALAALKSEIRNTKQPENPKSESSP